MDQQIDRYFLSCRRLCVDNHLNETLHASIIMDTSSSSSSSSPSSAQNSASSSSSTVAAAVVTALSDAYLATQLDNRRTEMLSNNANYEQLNRSIRQFYASIPILVHDTPMFANAESSTTTTITSATATATTTNDTSACGAIEHKFLAGVHGRNVSVSQPDRLIAYRESQRHHRLHHQQQQQQQQQQHQHQRSSPTSNAYVFLDKPIEKGKFFCLQIVGVDPSPSESRASLAIGCTTCSPHTLNARIDLPDDSNELIDRAEYWVVHKNLCQTISEAAAARRQRQQQQQQQQHQRHNTAAPIVAAGRASSLTLADELCFRLDDLNGNLNFYLNGDLVAECLFNVDITQRLWFFFDLCGKTNAVRLIPTCQPIPAASSSSTQIATATTTTTTTLRSTLSSGDRGATAESAASTRRRRPNSALIDYYKSQITAQQRLNVTETTVKHQQQQQSVLVDQVAAEQQPQLAQKQQQQQKRNSRLILESKDECRICLDAPIECVFYSCGHMCLCWNWLVRLFCSSFVVNLTWY